MKKNSNFKIRAVDVIIPERRSRQSGEVGATSPA